MKDIPGYEGLYAVTEDGRVWSYGKRGHSGKFLKPTSTGNGYLCVSLTKDSVKKTKNVHRLVSKALIPNPENKPQINHINGVKTDNRIENLEWCTISENAIHSSRVLLKPRGRRNGKKLFQIDRTGKIISIFDSLKSANIQTGISKGNIGCVLRGTSKTAGGYIWEYLDYNKTTQTVLFSICF